MTGDFNEHRNSTTSCKMKTLSVVLFSAVIFAVAVARPQEEEKYPEIEDSAIDDILKSDRLVNQWIGCFKGLKKCTTDAQRLKDNLPDALQNDCAKCSDNQKRQGRKVLDYLLEKKAADFKELENIYDPEHVYKTKYADQLKKEGIVLPS